MRDRYLERQTTPRCLACGRRISPRSDGLLRRHRIEADNPAAAWCEQKETT